MVEQRNLFAGVNSPNGFFSYFSYISDEIHAKRKIFIKGGSGMGKSSFMKRVAEKALQKGMNVERFHCSSDDSSLDGVNIPQLGVSLVDGTAPHISDPSFQAASGEIMNFAEFLTGKKSTEQKAEEAKIALNKTKEFNRGYAYLKAAERLIPSSGKSVFSETVKIADRFIKPTNNVRGGRERKLFLSAFCPGGVKSYYDEVFENVYTVSISGEVAHDVLNMLRDIASERGYDTECFYCPMFPDTLCDHVFIPRLELAFSAQNAYHVCTGDEVVDLTAYNCFEDDFEIINMLITRATNCFEKAKSLHLEIERGNVSLMNFDALNTKCDEVIKSIFS